MWGNPVAEMMYEGLRYFAGKGSPSSAFAISASGNDDATLNLPLPAWNNPYASGDYCARPFQVVISDINPSFDTDQVPGTSFGTYAGDVPGLNVSTLGDTLWGHEYGSAKDIFIGQSESVSDRAPTVKTAQSFSTVRGLSPEEPSKLGGYLAGSIAYFGQTNDVNPTASEVQNMSTFSVALASPLPQIKIPVGGRTITLVPFAKSVAGSSISAASNMFQPTNTIVDYYVDHMNALSGKFRINFEDVEQGADHDMDAIVEYNYRVNADNTLTVTLNSTYAAGGITQHMGYVISGTTADGLYLEVRDCDTANSGGTGTCSGNNPSTDPDYYLDTPPGVAPNGIYTDGQAVAVDRHPHLYPANSGTATFLKDPLWYAAKYGRFEDNNGNMLPDAGEWDKDGDGDPDNYFLVTNALTLSDQLSKAFSDILGTSSSAAAIATNSTRLDTNTLVYQARFDSNDWSGQIMAYPVNAEGGIEASVWEAGELIPLPADRHIYTINKDTSEGILFTWDTLTVAQKGYLNKDAAGATDNLGSQRLSYLRGVRTGEEQQGGTFRTRSRILGDIVNSDPWFAGTQNYGYDRLPGAEGASYLTFRHSAAYQGRLKMLYLGANDGMLHAIDAETGVEKFAYVPGVVFPNLSALTSPDYEHRFYIDGSPRASDAYIDIDGNGEKEWRTILVGTLGAGGKGIFAMDVTDPDNFSQSDILWEITSESTGFADLGFGIGQQPFIIRMQNGEWAAIFGNGFGSTAQNAVLYIVSLLDGSLIKAIDVGDAAGANGLSGAAPVDYHRDRIVDAVYAGDLKGNLWKFDVSDCGQRQLGRGFYRRLHQIPIIYSRRAQ